MTYDAVVAGCGVAGLSMAHYLARDGKKVLLLEATDVVGGCNKNYRNKDHLFSEHAPRVAFTSYLVFDDLLRDMGSSLQEVFETYAFSAKSTASVFSALTPSNLLALALAMLRVTLQPNYGHDLPAQEFMKQHRFSAEATNTMERLCRLVDGAGSDRLAMSELLYILQNSILHKGLQPRQRYGDGLFPMWCTFLQGLGVEIQCNAKVASLAEDHSTGTITSILLTDGSSIATEGALVILAFAPRPLAQILAASAAPNIQNTFGPLQHVQAYAEATAYREYITFTFNWTTTHTQLPKEWGFPRGEWGVGFIEMTKTAKYTVLSCAIVFPDTKSLVTGKTANESTASEIMSESFRQLSLNVPLPDHSILCPDLLKRDTGWSSRQQAYVSSVGQPKQFHARSKRHCNLYSVGTHNGKHTYLNTSIESAVSNSLALAQQLGYATDFRKRRAWTLWWVLRVVIAVITVVYVARRELS